MSDLPGAMTKQMRVAPPRTIRSIRYSVTARGRSTPSSNRLPMGSSSFENASGWMRLPSPAAGMMPHMVDAFPSQARSSRANSSYTCCASPALLGIWPELKFRPNTEPGTHPRTSDASPAGRRARTSGALRPGTRLLDRTLQVEHAPFRRVAVQRPLARGRGNAPTGLIVGGQRRERVLGIVRDEDLAPGFEERVQTLPCIRQDGYAARGR